MGSGNRKPPWISGFSFIPDGQFDVGTPLKTEYGKAHGFLSNPWAFTCCRGSHFLRRTALPTATPAPSSANPKHMTSSMVLAPVRGAPVSGFAAGL